MNILFDIIIQAKELFANFLNTATWLQQAEALIIFLGVPIAIFRLFFYRPRHKIFFNVKEKDAYQEATLTNVEGRPRSFWAHGFVKNKGLGESKRAMCYLVEVWKTNSNGLYELYQDFKAPVPLKWAHEEDVEPRNILPRSTKKFDLCYVGDSSNLLFLETQHFPSGTNKGIFPPGEYLFRVVVSSENTILPASKIFKVKWSSRYPDLVVSEYKAKSFQKSAKPIKSFQLF